MLKERGTKHDETKAETTQVKCEYYCYIHWCEIKEHAYQLKLKHFISCLQM